jgi:hypothetical protein
MPSLAGWRYIAVRATELIAAFATAFGVTLALIGWFGGRYDPVHGGLFLFFTGLMLALPGSVVWLVAYLVRRALVRSARSASLPLQQN